jgi:hypothetical protein
MLENVGVRPFHNSPQQVPPYGCTGAVNCR